jgi:hypothetical protein
LREFFFWAAMIFFFRGVGLWAATGRETWDRRVDRVGMRGVGEKKISFFGKKHSQNCDFWYFIVLPPYALRKHMTGGSGVRGKTDPI